MLSYRGQGDELAVWSADPTAPRQSDSITLTGPAIAGGAGALAVLPFAGASMVLTGGSPDGGFWLLPFGTDGTFGAATALDPLPEIYDGFQNAAVVPLPQGGFAVFGGFAGGSGLGGLVFDAAGQLLSEAIIADSATHPAPQITASAQLSVGGQSILLSTSAGDNSLTAWMIDTAAGAATQTMTLTPAEGLWVNAPTTLATAQLAEKAYVILGAAGSQSLTVIEVTATGEMLIRDHLLDGRDTRFGGVTSLAVLSVDERVYVAAGGADDGVSLFVLLDGGMLVHLAALADTDAIGLANISALAWVPETASPSLIVASAAEPGLTYLSYDPGPFGRTLYAESSGSSVTGTAGADILYGLSGHDRLFGGEGADILRDGAGQDMLTGGAGADIFVLSADGQRDQITDFTLGEDRLDLSLWPGLRDISQLWFSLRDDGVEIRYGDEVLIVQSAAGTMIDYRAFSTADLIGGSRFSANLQPGEPGPLTPAPDPNGPAPAPQTPEPGAHDPLLALQLLSMGNLQTLRIASEAAAQNTGEGAAVLQTGSAGADLLRGTDSADVLIGGAGADVLLGGAGDDLLLGRDGHDSLTGDAGADRLLGGAGDDLLTGGNGQDWLSGGDGNDRLAGGIGDDQLFGGAGADDFVFDGGADTIGDFTPGIDRITLDPQLWTGLTNAADLLMVYATSSDGNTVICFDDDTCLMVLGIADPMLLVDDLALV